MATSESNWHCLRRPKPGQLATGTQRAADNAAIRPYAVAGTLGDPPSAPPFRFAGNLGKLTADFGKPRQPCFPAAAPRSQSLPGQPGARTAPRSGAGLPRQSPR